MKDAKGAKTIVVAEGAEGSPQPAAPVDAESVGWMGGLTQSAGEYCRANPVKTTVGAAIIGGITKERVIDPLLDWGIDKGKALFAAGAEKSVAENVGDEAVAHLTGALDSILSVVSKAFDSVTD